MNEKIFVLDIGEVALIDVMGDDQAILQAARISYSSNKKKEDYSDAENEGLIRYLLRNQHTSCFEMVEFKFYLKLPIFVHNQLVRHRMSSQNVLSGRYSQMKDEFYVPAVNVITTQNPNNKQGGTEEQIMSAGAMQAYFKSEAEQAFKTYQEDYITSGMRKELARINLPLSTYTELYWKIDLHNLLHFLKLRLDSHAQYEIRVFADALYELIKPYVPISCQAFEDYTLNSVKFSKPEMDLLQDVVAESFRLAADEVSVYIKAAAVKYFTNDRERKEAVSKVSKVFQK